MADCFSQMYVQIVFAVKNRQALIMPEWEDEVYKYITGIVKNKGQKLLAINGTHNHIHIFINMKPSCCLSDLVREIKKSSNAYINEKKLSHFKFEWQNGYGAFTYSISDIGNVIKYINNQKEHHHKQTFKEEFHKFLMDFQIEYNEAYSFEWIE
ncbi:MAG: IS200/IS605 family transposase [Bacteroidales bacterium]|nr:IS200/IS605 family transposase [Bacteroidales bacterium]